MAKRKTKISSVLNKFLEPTYTKLNAIKFGLAGGIVTGICVLLTTIAGIYGILGGFPLWNSVIVDIYGGLGYGVSWTGALLGVIYGFIDGFAATWLFAWVYNKLI